MNVLFFSEYCRSVDQQLCGVGVEGLCDQMLIRNGGTAVVVCITWCIEQPVAEMIACIPQIIDCMGADIIYPCFHTGVLITQDRGITVCQVNIPGSDGGYVAPAGGGIVFWTKDIGDDIGYG